MAVSMEDLISTMKTSAHVGQGSDLRELQAQLNETLPNVPINRSSQNTGSLFDCPPPPASSWNDQPAQNAFLSSSPFTARLMAHAAAQANPQSNQNQNRASIPAPNAGSQQQNQNQPKQNGGQGQGQAMDNRRETRSSHKAMSPDTDHFANDAFRPLYEKSEGKSKGFGKGK